MAVVNPQLPVDYIYEAFGIRQQPASQQVVFVGTVLLATRWVATFNVATRYIGAQEVVAGMGKIWVESRVWVFLNCLNHLLVIL